MATEIVRGDAGDVPFIMASERLAGYDALVGRWDAAQHQTALADGHHAYFVACADGRRIGFAIVRGWNAPDHVASIKRVAMVEPGQGFGRSFLRGVVERIFTETEAHRIWLGVFPENVRARRAYEAVGFVPEGIARGAALLGGVFRDELVMATLRTDRPR